MKKFIVSYIVINLLLFASSRVKTQEQEFKKELVMLFMTIEDPDSPKKTVDLAIQKILAFGKKVKPIIRKRFTKTSNYHYFYILEKIKKNNKKTRWSKKHYFSQKFKQAKLLLKNGETQKASKIAQAILILEPNIIFREKLKELLRICKKKSFSSTVAVGILSAQKQYFNQKQKIVIKISLKNYLNIPILMLTGKKNGIIINTLLKIYTLEGGYKEQTFSNIISINDKISLKPGINYFAKFRIPHTIRNINLFQIVKISAQIPRCTILTAKKRWYPKFSFNDIQLFILPKEYNDAISQPLEIAQLSLKLGYPKYLFFASFFLKSKEKSKIIPKLIDGLGKEKFYRINIGILQRLTNKKFTTKNKWQKWWKAQKEFLE